ncbi:MAG: hypothetical protein EB141_00495 [Verrucomicrobia bacterium]|nr:hypothetical protein [Verrucomicrobiota bacterium]NBV22548.1 hypothetical protein [Pseudomonadota bacterium]NDA65267.1 hypothetical protein [Verrucomicrobiota bacterium]NDB74122.1 hypothetical protein [Verrucomicrobiota bacterium]NDD36806.1 hypothetical protein [Verrucomicrobiota bacterium]
MTEPRPTPELVALATDLKAAFQQGSDKLMLNILDDETESDKGLLRKLIAAIYVADDRTLTYAAPQIASLAERIGWLSAGNE